jgi:nicotinamide-nucleotide adenylyltransferase
VRGLLVGRFQPLHLGHLAVVREIRAARPDEPLILGVGSAQASFSWKNPFTAGERLEMIAAAISEAGLSGIEAIPIPDLGRYSLWVAHVESFLPKFDRVYTNNPLTQTLFERAGYPVTTPTVVDRDQFEGERVRLALADDRGWKEAVPPAVAAWLARAKAPERLRVLRAGPDGPVPAGGA